MITYLSDPEYLGNVLRKDDCDWKTRGDPDLILINEKKIAQVFGSTGSPITSIQLF